MARNTLEDMSYSDQAWEQGNARRTVHTLLPDPSPRPIAVPIVSVDDHFVEPPDLFTSRMRASFGDAIPQVIEDDEGVQYWRFEDVLDANRVATTSVVGRPLEEWTIEPVRFDEMRPGSYAVAARLDDMDFAGVAASMCFPSVMFGFAGQRLYRMKDQELGLAAMRAYNDWIIEEWVATDPNRFIPQQITWLPDPGVAAEEVRRNAARGFKAVTFSENPEVLGFPSLHTGHWDPFFQACDETRTVVNLHVGSSSSMPEPSTDSPPDARLALFPVNAMMASVDWVYSRVPVRYPGLRVALSEGGLSWVPMVLERLRRNNRMRDLTLTWRGVDESPEEVFRRTFWFCSIEDPSGIEARELIGRDRIMVEVDYPHVDSSWPDTQQLLQLELGHLPAEDVRMIAYENACALYGHPQGAVEEIIAGW
jgi:predicted TIM-barrel fold metal-dependent hydrolase